MNLFKLNCFLLCNDSFCFCGLKFCFWDYSSGRWCSRRGVVIIFIIRSAAQRSLFFIMVVRSFTLSHCSGTSDECICRFPTSLGEKNVTRDSFQPIRNRKTSSLWELVTQPKIHHVSPVKSSYSSWAEWLLSVLNCYWQVRISTCSGGKYIIKLILDF